MKKSDVDISLRDGLIWRPRCRLRHESPEFKSPSHYLRAWPVSHLPQASVSSSIKEEEGGSSSLTELLLGLYSSCNFSVDSKFFKINSWEGKKEYRKKYVYISPHFMLVYAIYQLPTDN